MARKVASEFTHVYAFCWEEVAPAADGFYYFDIDDLGEMARLDLQLYDNATTLSHEQRRTRYELNAGGRKMYSFMCRVERGKL